MLQRKLKVGEYVIFDGVRVTVLSHHRGTIKLGLLREKPPAVAVNSLTSAAKTA